jgi:alkylation response protein AidB-like acyl-CoA dehydrogenase
MVAYVLSCTDNLVEILLETRPMDFSLNDDQTQLQASFGRLFERYSSTADVRAAEPLGFSAPLWRRLTDLGVPQLATASGGEGPAASLSQLIVIAEEFGRRLAPVPLLETLTSARALDRAGVALPDSGIVTLALRPVGADGEARLLAAGAVATAALAYDGSEFVLAELDGTAADSFVSNLGSSPLGHRRLGPRRTVLASGEQARGAFDRALDDWKILLAAALVGLAEQAHGIAVAYVKDRKAFGVPVGWFQTVAHRLADSVNDLDGAKFLTHKAAWAVDADDEAAPRLASMAYAYTTALAERVTAESLHFHGGIGYTLEHDIQLYFRRAKTWPLALGDPRRELAAVAARTFGPIGSS